MILSFYDDPGANPQDSVKWVEISSSDVYLHTLAFSTFSSFSHGFGSIGGHASCPAYVDQLESSHEWEDTADAVERHV